MIRIDRSIPCVLMGILLMTNTACRHQPGTPDQKLQDADAPGKQNEELGKAEPLPERPEGEGVWIPAPPSNEGELLGLLEDLQKGKKRQRQDAISRLSSTLRRPGFNKALEAIRSAALHDADPGVRKSALFSLYLTSHKEAFDTVLEVFRTDPDPTVHHWLFQRFINITRNPDRCELFIRVCLRRLDSSKENDVVKSEAKTIVRRRIALIVEVEPTLHNR